MTRAPLTPLELAIRRKRIIESSKRLVTILSKRDPGGQRVVYAADADELTGTLAWTAKTDDDDAAKAAREVVE
ncbi:MAG TPA: hypothetical protein VMY76_00840 [Gemmatimonadales bacterium]|nr:hypothetical protein [Gemmatimonadales bacterium]